MEGHDLDSYVEASIREGRGFTCLVCSGRGRIREEHTEQPSDRSKVMKVLISGPCPNPYCVDGTVAEIIPIE